MRPSSTLESQDGIILVPLDILKNNFNFNTKNEELFDFKGDSPVYSLPGNRDFPVYSSPGSFRFSGVQYSPQRSLDSQMNSSPGSDKFNSLVYSLPGSRDSP